MKKLDWYILRNFLVTFFFAIFLFSIISVVVDISQKTDIFVTSGLSAWQITRQYYLGFIPHIVALLFPLFVFIAVIFFTSKLAGRTEIVAILASGTSFRRFLRPYFLGGLILGGLLWLANQYLIPVTNGVRTTFDAKYIHPNSSYDKLNRKSSNVYLQIDENRVAGIHYYDTAFKNGGPFFIHQLKNNHVVYNLRAESIRWDTAARRWALSNVTERRINGVNETIEKLPSQMVKLSFTPADLKRDDYAKDNLITPDLDRFIKMQELRGVEGLNVMKVERYRRDATAFSVLLLSLIGAIIASKKVRGGSGVHLAYGIGIAAIFILMDKFSTIFSTNSDLPPLIAAWLPNIIFTFVAMYQYMKAPK